MSLTRENVQKIRAIFDASDCDEMTIGVGNAKLGLRKRDGGTADDDRQVDERTPACVDELSLSVHPGQAVCLLRGLSEVLL